MAAPQGTDRVDFWTGKRVLITGHTGFKGGWLALWLQDLGAQVIGLAVDPPTDPSLFELGHVGEGMVSRYGDVRDFRVVLEAFERHQPEIVFHLAAQPIVRTSYESPVETIETNVMGTVHVLEAMRQVKSVRAGVFVTSDKCYENTESELWGYRETDAIGGRDPYSSSKGGAELMVSAYRRSFFSAKEGTSPERAVATVRAGNVIGGGDWADDRLIPDMVRAFSEGRPVHIRRPDSIRPWQHVLDPLSGYLQIAQSLWEDEGQRYAEAWNFAPRERDAKPVGYVVRQMAERWGDGASAILDEGTHPHEATYLRLDCSKARVRLGWTSRLSLDEALAWTVDWYQAVLEGKDARAMTLQQIHQFRALRRGAVQQEEAERPIPIA